MDSSTDSPTMFNQNEASSSGKVYSVSTKGLHSPNSPVRIDSYIARIWALRTFIGVDAKSRALNSGRETFLGNVWIILNPVLQSLLYILIFGIVLKTDRGISNFVGFLIIGVTFFGFITQGLRSGAGLLQSSKNIITSFGFPAIAVPLSRSLRNVYDNLPPALIAITIAIATEDPVRVSWRILLAVPIFFLMIAFSTGLMLITARLTTFVPDTKSLVSLLNRGLFFISGIFFSLDRFNGHDTLKDIMMANPIYQYLTAMRAVVLDAPLPSTKEWILMTAWALGTLVFGFLYFWRGEGRYANYL